MKFDLPHFAKKLDFFGAPIPSFNLRGQTEVTTSIGVCFSIIISALTLACACVKFEHLANRKNPMMTSNETPLEPSEIYELG